MLTARGVRRSFGPHEVLLGVDWAVPPGSRWGLIGPNGCGKTTLLEILSGIQPPDDGKVERPGRTTVAYLPQEGGALSEGSLLEAILSPFTEIASMEAEILRLQESLARLEAAGEGDRIASQLGDLQHRFEAAGGFRIEAEAKVILGGLGFAPEDHRRPITEFSGGYRTRALLGSLLLRRPDYLLLDEPTNHLDLDGIQWLEEYLNDLPSAVVVVSHDRLFLNRTVQSIAEMDRGRIVVFRGNYDRYRKEKAGRLERARAAATREEKKAAQVERFIERFRYKASKARQVQDRVRMLERLERTEVPVEETAWGFRFTIPSRLPGVVLELQDVTRSFGDQPVLKGISLTLMRGERVALVGPNGCGKTTLLRIAAGMLATDGGEVRLGEKVIVRYVAQHLIEALAPGRTVFEEVQSLAPGAGRGEIRSLLGIFQFSGEDVFKNVDLLSGGEKNRLALARLVLQPGHLLLLDEPTNHLDLAAREALEAALLAHEGSVLLVSHDRYFINRVAHRVAGFHEGRLRMVSGGYDDYLAFLRDGGNAGGSAGLPREGKEAARTRRKEERRVAAEARNARSRIVKGLRRKVEGLESEISGLEERLQEIRVILADTATYRKEGLAESLGREEKILSSELEGLFERWEEAGRSLREAEVEGRLPE
jgi:ATP-binding cassette subfamily F protein 3